MGSISIKKFILLFLIFIVSLFLLATNFAPPIYTPSPDDKTISLEPVIPSIAPTSVYNGRTPLDPPVANEEPQAIIEGASRLPISNRIVINCDNDYINDYGSIDYDFNRYYLTAKNTYGSLDNYYEDNYYYSNGEHSVSFYEGVLSHIICDLDSDGTKEMLLFRMSTDNVDEFSTKRIYMDLIRKVDGQILLCDSVEILGEQFYGEKIDCLISMKYVNETWRVYINYVEHKINDDTYESMFKCYEYSGNMNLITELNYSGTLDEYDNTYDLVDQVVDAGINIDSDVNIRTRAFINDDSNVLPIHTIKRVNEKLRNGYAEQYFEEHADLIDENGVVKLKYGYTTFIDRTK